MSTADDETTKLTEAPSPSNGAGDNVDDAIEKTGSGLGLFLYSVGPFLFYCVEGAEIVILSIIALILGCEWDLSTTEIAILQSVAMIGMMVSSFLSSGMGDKYGRRRMALISVVGTTVVGVASGFTTHYWQFIILRALIGTFIGMGYSSAAALLGEVAPIKFRSLGLSICSIAWGVGCSLTSGLAYLLIEPYGWRGLIIGTSLLFSPSILFLTFTNESPRFDAIKGNWSRAEKTLRSIARLNGNSSLITLKRTETKSGDTDGSAIASIAKIRELGLLKDFILVSIFSTSAVYIYYSLSYATPRFVNESYCGLTPAPANKSCVFDSKSLFDIGVIGLFEPFGVLAAAILIDMLGRKVTFQIANTLLFLALIALYFCVNRFYLMSFLIMCKFTTAVQCWVPIILSTEYFPTAIRTFALSIVVSLQRVGALLGLLTVNYLFNAGPRVVLAVNQGADVITTFCMVFLTETRGVQLQ